VNIEANAAPKALRNLDVIVIGAGFAGLYAHYSLRKPGLSLCGFEAAPDVGGTWFWNGYPGARCEVESLDYSYSFSEELQNEWRWSDRFATQPEILRYSNHVAERFDLRRDIAFETRVNSARYDQLENLWTVETDRGDTARCRFLIAATGALRDAWAQGPSSYLGLMIAGFPNFFAVTGPGSPSVLANVVSAIEHHVGWDHQMLGAHAGQEFTAGRGRTAGATRLGR
jgi:cation diffusion facilitator CzcD-associated flavoprotein CzcO